MSVSQIFFITPINHKKVNCNRVAMNVVSKTTLKGDNEAIVTFFLDNSRNGKDLQHAQLYVKLSVYEY
jgi:hypothetical protein